MKSFLGFVEALTWAGSTMSRPLPDVVVVTRAVHACVEADKVMTRVMPIAVISSTLEGREERSFVGIPRIIYAQTRVQMKNTAVCTLETV